jgi:AcrR family transcriptional regulator
MTEDSTGPESGSQHLVPVTVGSAGGGRGERADAARNRQRVLEAARDLFRARGVEAVTMDDVAGAAGVGKGTLYRRFGDKAGLAAALLDRREADLQEQILTGPAPLGPGAGQGQRLGAFLHAYLDLVDTDLGLLVMAEKGTGRLHSGAYAFWRAHVTSLLRTGGAAIDPELGADLLLAGVAAELYDHLHHGRGRSHADIVAAVEALAAALLPPTEGA